MKLKLSEWASLAEIGASVAVIATLLLLLVGIRDNTEITRLAVYNDLVDSMDALEREILRDPELVRIHQAMWDESWRALDDESRWRLQLMYRSLLRGFGGAYKARQIDLTEDREWERITQQICTLLASMRERDFEGSLNFSVEPEFYEFMISACSSAD
jgi:hypothetical protein